MNVYCPMYCVHNANFEMFPKHTRCEPAAKLLVDIVNRTDIPKVTCRRLQICYYYFDRKSREEEKEQSCSHNDEKDSEAKS